MQELLQKSHRDQLVTWIGKASDFRLLYKISRDGCSATTFHQQCDGQGATVTVLYNTNKTIYGGYLSQSWNSSGTYINDSKAFLFRLQYNGSSSPLKFPVSDASKAGYGKEDYGPAFGSGNDIKTFSGQINCSGNAFNLNGSLSSLGVSYNLNGQNARSVLNSSLNVTDMEVYLVIDGQEQYRPWREHSEWTIETMQELKETLLDYKPMTMTETNVPAANILLIGQTGAGKSSFFNSINSIFRGKITNRAVTGRSEHSVTTMFNPIVPFAPDTHGCSKDPDLKDKIHCVAFVIDGSTVDDISDKVKKQMKDLQVRINHRRLPQVVLLTNIDKICHEIEDDVTNTFVSASVYEALKTAAEITGLSRDHVFPVKNYESERSLKTAVDILLMEAMRQILDFADEFIDEQLHRVTTEKGKYLTKD